MKNILFFLLILVSFQSFGQVPTGFQARRVNERIQGKFMVDTAFYLPRYTDTVQANLHKSVDTCGSMFFSYTKDSVYYRACNPKRWITVGSRLSQNWANTDLTYTGDRTHNAFFNTTTINNIDSWTQTAGTSGNYTTKLQDSTVISLYALKNGPSSSQIDVRADSIRFLPDRGEMNIDSLRDAPNMNRSKVMVRDTVTGAWFEILRDSIGGGSGTINSGTTGKPAYYTAATTLDDFIAVDYALTGAHQIITAQNTTDTNLVLKGTSAQTAPFFAARNSGGTVLTQVTKDGYGWFPAGSASANSQGIKIGSTGIFDLGTGVGYYFGGGSGYQAALGQFGLLFGQGDAVIDLGQSSTFGTTNRIRMAATAEGTVKFHSLGLTAATIIKGTGGEGTSSSLYLEADEADDGADTWKLTSETGNDFTFTNNATENLRIISTGGLRMPEISAPSTPASATAVIYPKSDGLWYGKDDAGVETKLSNDFSGSPTLQQVLDAGSTLGSNETITVGANTLDITGTGEAFKVNTTTVGNAFQVTNSGAGGGIFSVTQAGKHYTGQSTYTSTNAVEETLRSNMFSSGTTANGFGQTWIFNLENGSGSSVFANGIFSKYKDVTAANRTAQFGATGVIRGSTDTLMTLGDYVTLTESSATKFTSTTIVSGSSQGGTILITIYADDATDYQSRTLRFIWSAVNKAGTLTITISTPEEVVAVSAGTLTCTITATDAGSGVVSFNANAVSSLTQTTLRATYQTFKNF